ncbi:MAG: membrane dipeptidase [Gemmatimonadetes bacterium]|nr:membrane dipeptidase [Gemmatimonadota bacterium]
MLRSVRPWAGTFPLPRRASAHLREGTMSRWSSPRALCAVLLVSPLFACSGGETPPAAETEEQLLARAKAIHERVITLDTHNDILGNWGTPELNPCEATGQKVDIPKMVAGGLKVTFPAVYVGQGPRTPEAFAEVKAGALEKFAAIHRVAEQMCPDKVEIAYRADDVERIAATGKRVYAIGIENGYIVGKDLANVKQYYDLGARYITLTHSGHNDIADSSTPREGPAEEWGGLSPFGEEVVKEMNRLGMMIDLSHVADATVQDVFAISKAPVIASHSGARALSDVPRNLSDELLQGLKANGGGIQIVDLASYLKADPPERTAAIDSLRASLGFTDRATVRSFTEADRAAYQARMDSVRPQYEAAMAEIDAKWPPADVKTMVDHVDYVKKLIGVDHVGIGTDFDGGGGVKGFNDAGEALNVTVEMVRRGYTEEEIAKIWGGNLLRVWREVERVAAEQQAAGS